MTIKLGFLASGGGTSIEALVENISSGKLSGFEPRIALCNKPRGKAGIYERADRLNLPIEHTRKSEKQLSILKEYEVDLVLGLGYIKMVGDEILDYFGNRIWNIHPALLPKHGGKGMYGLATHESVLNSGDAETGATVHIMSPVYDDGKILNQVKIPVFQGETPESLQQRVLPFEYLIMASTLALYRDNLLPNCPR